ncbi:hypothetical protein WJX73_005621 [Symbiochloris irregularis]|uniref:BZIP domain-containing protein n=1 Tax=Symbiochloris irregularis TaxID=706552 RepID=A0AAW1PLF2_9CHLO
MEDEARANGSKAQPAGVMMQAPDPATSAASAPFFPGGVAYFPGNTTGVHPYSIFAGQGGVPLVYGGPVFGGILPYGFPAAAPAATAPAPSLPANGRQEDPGSEARQDSGQTNNSGDRIAEAHAARLRTASSHSQQPESPQAGQSGYTVMTSDAGATSSGAAALAALAAAQAQVAGTDLRQAAEMWRRHRSALESGQELPSLGPGDSGQDDREVKRMKRKQSNRESARRSRLRKQAECESLSGKVEELMHDNARLREANRLLQARVDTLTAQHDADRDDRTRQKGAEAAKPQDLTSSAHHAMSAAPAQAAWPSGQEVKA